MEACCNQMWPRSGGDGAQLGRTCLSSPCCPAPTPSDSHPLATRATRLTSKVGEPAPPALRPAKQQKSPQGTEDTPTPGREPTQVLGLSLWLEGGEGSRREALRLREAVSVPRRSRMLTARPRSLGVAQAHWFTVRMLPGSWHQVSSKWRKRSWADVGWRAEGCRWPGRDFGIWSASRGRGLRSAPEETPGALMARTPSCHPLPGMGGGR